MEGFLLQIAVTPSDLALHFEPSLKASTSALPCLVEQQADLLDKLHTAGWYSPTRQTIHGFSFPSHPEENKLVNKNNGIYHDQTENTSTNKQKERRIIS